MIHEDKKSNLYSSTSDDVCNLQDTWAMKKTLAIYYI